MSQPAQDDNLAKEDGMFTAESSRILADDSWRGRRKKKLKEWGLWETYKCVPPKKDRDAPLDSYLPGGENYDG